MIGSYKHVIFLHGVGSSGAAMRPLAEVLALPQPAVCPDGLQPFDMGAGRQWFSVKGVTEANRPGRIAEAMPAFADLIASLGSPRDSVLIGFSQGAIMALHAVAAGMPVAGVIALSGRLAGPVGSRGDWPSVTLMHGADDPVMPPAVARATEAWLQDAGATPRLIVFDGLGHAIDARILKAVRDTLSLSGGDAARLST
ncbi:alpha/beta hydrolase family protein [Fuscibacter oryzae]|uniref:Phospholipase/carboxylesterase/thioesterase domain-containing protein n=1 Tax=Fuscibacter oryzae TaxID=2803939 RepID=A0A8J7MZZ7_9RHOB|nr:hypothetical protein [Fuscibacter oryzae]MBL4929999.1 hypothetical protein [Fuscibacter oryzae]